MNSFGHYRRWTIFLILLLTIFRFWFCTYHELVEDESYYRLWSKHLDWSYYSKGPLIAWTIAFGTAVIGDTVLGIRWLSVLLSAVTGWMLFQLGTRLWNERVGFWAVVIAVTLPLYAIGSVLMTIDPLSVFFWVLAAHFFLNTIEGNRSLQWIACGLAVGFGFLAKFVNAIELLCFLLFLLSDSQKRALLLKKGFYLLLIAFAICMIPVFYWNAAHGWITATHLQERGALTREFTIQWKETGQFLYMQAVVISPFYFLGMLSIALSSLGLLLNSTPENRSRRFALALFLPIFLFYFLLSLNDSGEANWTATGLAGGILLLASYFSEESKSLRKRIFMGIALGLALIEMILLHDAYGLGIKFKGDPANRLRGWSDLAQKVESFREPQDLIIGNKYQTASILSFYLPDRPVTHIPKTERIQNQFSFWPSYELNQESRGILITDSIDEIPDALKLQFASIEKVADFYRQDRGRDLKRYQLYRLEKPIGF